MELHELLFHFHTICWYIFVEFLVEAQIQFQYNKLQNKILEKGM